MEVTNSFKHITLENINYSVFDDAKIAVLYAELYRDDDFFGKCMVSSSAYGDKYTLHYDYKTCNLLRLYYKSTDSNTTYYYLLIPKQWKKCYINNEPVYYLITDIDSKIPTQMTLSDLVIGFVSVNEGFTKYIVKQIFARATDSQIMNCMNVYKIKLSKGCYKPMRALDSCDVIIRCTDGEIKAHKLVLTSTSDLFKSVINASDETPIVVKFPFDKAITKILMDIIYSQKVSWKELHDADNREIILHGLEYMQIPIHDMVLKHFVKFASN
jgi:hypothetical protein